MDPEGNHIEEKTLDFSNPDDIIWLTTQNKNPIITTFFPTKAGDQKSTRFFYQPPPERNPAEHMKAFFYDNGLIRVFSISRERGIVFDSEIKLKDHKVFSGEIGLNYLTIKTQLQGYHKKSQTLIRVIKFNSTSNKKEYIFYQEVDLRDPCSTKQTILDNSSRMLTDLETEELVLSQPLSISNWLRRSLKESSQRINMTKNDEKIPALELSADKNYFYQGVLTFFCFINLREKRKRLSSTHCIFTREFLEIKRKTQFKNLNDRLSYAFATDARLLTVIKVYDRLRLKLARIIEFDPLELILEIIDSHGSVYKNWKLETCDLDIDLSEDVVLIKVKFGVQRVYSSSSISEFVEYLLRVKNYLLRRAEKNQIVISLDEENPPPKKCCFGQLSYSTLLLEKHLKISLFSKNQLKDPKRVIKIPRWRNFMDRITQVIDLGWLDQGRTIFFRDRLFLYLFDAESSILTSRTRYRTYKDRVQMDKKGKLCHKMFASYDKQLNKMEFFRLDDNQIFEAGEIDLTHHLKASKLKLPELNECKMGESIHNQLSILGSIWSNGTSVAVIVLYLDKDSLELTTSPIIIDLNNRFYKVHTHLDLWSYHPEAECWQTGDISIGSTWIVKLKIGRTLKNLVHVDWIECEKVNPFYKHRKTVEYVRFFGNYAYLQCKNNSFGAGEFAAYLITQGEENQQDWRKVGSIKSEPHTQQFCRKEGALIILLLRKEKKIGDPELWITNHELNVLYKFELWDLPIEISVLNLVAFPEILAGAKLLLRFGSRHNSDYYGLFFLIDLQNLRLIGLKESLEGVNNIGNANNHEENLDSKQFWLRFWGKGLVQLSNFKFNLN